jgi:hypothetical protein
MNRLTVAVVSVGIALVFGTAGCGGSSTSTGQQRHLKASLKYERTGTHSIGGGQLVQTRAIDVIKAGMKAQAKLRAAKSPPFAKALATHFTRLGAAAGQPDRLLATARSAGKHPLDVAFDANVAAFAFDDTSGEYLDEQYLNPDTGEYDLVVPDDSPVSVWVGTYDEASTMATFVAPFSYGFDYEFPPYAADISWEYDGYFWAPPADVAVVGGYAPLTNDQSGYYQMDWVNDDGSTGTGWFYLLPDTLDVGSYYWIWDDGTCSQGVQVYVSFDASGTYFSLNGVDGPMSVGGVTGNIGYFGGNGRWTVTGEDGLTYYATVAITYLGVSPTTTFDLCPAGTLVVPPDPSVCPAGCSLDADFGVCVIDGTLDPATSVGLSCDLYDSTLSVIVCPVGCTEDTTTGFCYDDVTGDICY